MPTRSDDDIWAEDFPVILGQGSLHDLRDHEEPGRRSRLWDLKSTSEAACKAADRTKAKAYRQRKAGFAHRRPR